MRLLLLPLLLLLAACAAEAAGSADAEFRGSWLGRVALSDPTDPLSLEAPKRVLIVIYNHGSRAEFRRDRCHPGAETTPPVLRDLAGTSIEGLEVAVFAFCTRSRLGDFDESSGEGEPKVIKRAREIAALARGFVRAGVPAQRIFLAGQSAGGWAALLAAAATSLAAETPSEANLGSRDAALGGVVAFAPAFAGPVEDRPETWQTLRDTQAAELAALPWLAGLVYAFEGDRYEPPADLHFLARIPGVTLLARPGDRLGGRPCGAHEAHLRAFADCFAAAETARLRGFLAERVLLGGGA